MTQASLSAGELERLPWLSDEAQPAKTGSLLPVTLWGGLAALLIAGASYWVGRSADHDFGPAVERSASSPPAGTATLDLGEPRPAPAPEVKPALPPQVEEVRPAPPVPLPKGEPVALERQAGETSRAEQSTDRAANTERAAAQPRAERPAAKARATPRPASRGRYWSSWESAGASGRMVRIGTYRSSRQAKIGWRKLTRVYPGIRRMKAVVVRQPSLRNGRTYYRLQFGTSSQAHSAVLCQWMRSIGQSCVVVGRPSTTG
jgi:hypothetical protein